MKKSQCILRRVWELKMKAIFFMKDDDWRLYPKLQQFYETTISLYRKLFLLMKKSDPNLDQSRIKQTNRFYIIGFNFMSSSALEFTTINIFITQKTNSCLKPTTDALEKSAKYVQS